MNHSNMNRNQAKTLSPIIKAFSEGKTIQSRCIKGDTSLWYDDGDLSFDDDFEYRIKPEPKYRPFANAEECWAEMQKHQPFGWIFSRKTGVAYLIRCIDDNRVFTSIQYSFDSAFKNFVFADLVPFGVKVEE